MGQVEANDAVTVASMARPKPLPNEVLSDLSVSVATKLQCYKVLGLGDWVFCCCSLYACLAFYKIRYTTNQYILIIKVE